MRNKKEKGFLLCTAVIQAQKKREVVSPPSETDGGHFVDELGSSRERYSGMN